MKKITIILLCIIAISSISYAQLGVYSAGDGAGASNTSGDFNTFVGDSAGYTNTTGLYNTFIGYRAGYNLNFATFTQSDNTVIGAEAMGGNPVLNSSTDNVIIGKMAGYNHYGTDVVIIGTQAGFYNENGADVVFIGEESGYSNTTGDDNVFVGEDAGYSNTTASDNTFVGNQAGRSNTTGVRNAFFGNEAGWDCTVGDRNTFIGDSAGIDVSDGHHNTFIGQASGSCTEYADYNTFVGSYAGWDNNRTNEANNANFNTYLGYGTGYTNREGQYNVLLGAMTDFSSSAMSGNGTTNSYNIGIGYDALINGERVYSCVIGSNARVSSDNSFVIGGTTSVTRMSVGIGTDTPNQNSSLELAENDKGFLITRMSNSERTTFEGFLGTTDIGMMVYDSTSHMLNIWNGTTWINPGIQNLGLAGNNLSITDGNTVDLSAYLDNTDAQDLSLSGNTLSLTNDASSVDLSGYLDNTDAQDLSLTGNTLSLSNDGTTVDLSGYLDNTDTQLTEAEVDAYVANNGYLTSFTEVDGDITNEIQDLQLVGNDLTITNNGSATIIDLSPYLDNTDTDTHLTEAEVDVMVDNNGYLTSFTEVDGDINNEIQDLQLVGNNLSITINAAATTIDLSPYLDNTDTHITEAEVDVMVDNNGYLTSFTEVDGDITNEIQDLQLVGNNLTITNNGSATTIDLSPYLDDTDTDTHLTEAEVDAYVSNNGYLTSFTEVDGDITNEIQDLQLVGNDLTITNNGSATTIDLSPYLDDTDTDTHLTEAEVDAFADNNGYLTSFTEVDGDVTNEIQDLDLTGNTLSIENGNSVDLSAYLDNTDTHLSEAEVDAMVDNNGYLTSFTEVDGDITNEIQDISLVGTNLSISDGSTVDLSTIQDGTGTDEQTLSLNGTELTISNGNTIDLSSIVEPLQTEIDNLTDRVEYLELVVDDCCSGTKVEEFIEQGDEAILYQNIPNPWNETTTIKYYIPRNVNNAKIEIRTSDGKLVNSFDISAKGEGHLMISSQAFSEGTYLYSLYVDNRMIDTKRFVLTQ